LYLHPAEKQRSKLKAAVKKAELKPVCNLYSHQDTTDSSGLRVGKAGRDTGVTVKQPALP